MHLRIFVFLAVLFALANARVARADNTATEARVHVGHATRGQTTGIVLTSVGGSLVLSAPLALLVAGVAVTNPYDSTAVLGVTFLGAMAGATIGLGLLIPGVVMLATCRPSKRPPPKLPDAKQPAWTETRPLSSGGPRAFTIPILRGTF